MSTGESIGSMMAEGIEQGIDAGIDLWGDIIVKFITDNPILAIVLLVLIVVNLKTKKRRR